MEENTTAATNMHQLVVYQGNGDTHEEMEDVALDPQNEVAAEPSTYEETIVSEERLDEESAMSFTIDEETYVSEQKEPEGSNSDVAIVLEEAPPEEDFTEKAPLEEVFSEENDDDDPVSPCPSDESTQAGYTAISSVGCESARQAAFRRYELPHQYISQALTIYQVRHRNGEALAAPEETSCVLNDETDESDETAVGEIADEETWNQENGFENKNIRFAGFFRVCSYQRGKFEIAVILLSLVAFVVTGTAMDRCDFLSVGNAQLQSFWDLPERDLGLLQFETISRECAYWFENPDTAELIYDASWHAARVMSLAGTILGLTLVGFLCTQSCIDYSTTLLRRLSFATLIIPLLFGLSFVVLGSTACQKGTCQVGIGGLVMILGIILWFMAAVVLHLIPDTTSPKPDELSSQFINERRSRACLGIAVMLVMAFTTVIDVSVIMANRRSAGEGTTFPSATPQGKDATWVRAGEATMGPYPDSPNFISMSGDASMMSVIGKESVLALEYDNVNGLWYPFGDMISANLDTKGWDSQDRVTKIRATSASLSENGHLVAVGSSNWAQTKEGQSYEFGQVQVWWTDAQNRQWATVGDPITGNSKDDAFASRVALSRDGKRLAVLALGRFGKHKPYVRVFEYDDDQKDWARLGGDMELESTWAPSGFAFSGDGTTVALGSLRIGRVGLISVWLYDENSASWQRHGNMLDSGSAKREDEFGQSVALSANGAVLVVGDPGGSPSYARVFSFKNGSWHQLGYDIECDLDRCAHDVAISNLGSIVAITGYGEYQMAQVYTLSDGQSEWVKVGTDMIGEEPEESVQSTTIELSSNGQHVAFGILSQETMTHLWRYAGGDLADHMLQADEPVDESSSVSNTVVPSSQAPFSPTVTPANDIASVQSPAKNESAQMSNPGIPDDGQWTNTADMSYNASYLNHSTARPQTIKPQQPWIRAISREDVFYFLFGEMSRIERFNLSSQTFLPAIDLPVSHGPATAFGVDSYMYVGYGNEVFRYSLNGTDEIYINVAAEMDIIDFQFDGDIIFINAGKFFMTVDGKTNTVIKKLFSYNELVMGTSISRRHQRIFGRTPEEKAMVSGDIIRPSDISFKEYDKVGEVVAEKQPDLDEKVDIERASRTWVFPDQTRVVDDKGYVFSTTSAEHVYSIRTQEILDVVWLGGQVMIALHPHGSLSAISQELVMTGNHTLDYSPANFAVINSNIFTFTYDPKTDNGIRVDKFYLGLLSPSLADRPIDATNVPFTPSSPFVDKESQLYMMSKGHSSIFVMAPEEMQHKETIKLGEIPKYIAYSDTNHEIYTLREGGLLSKIELNSENRSEVAVANLPSTPLGLSTAGEFIFVCDDAGTFGTHYTFTNNGTLISSVGWNHIDKEYVWSEATRNMFFFRQADPTDLMTEHIDLNGTIGVRVDSYLNNNSGFVHPIRIDPGGHYAVLGSGIIHNARTLERMDLSLANSVLDIAFANNEILTIRQTSPEMAELQRWDGLSFELTGSAQIGGKAHRLLPMSSVNQTVAVTTDATTGVPAAHVVDGQSFSAF